MDAPSSPTPDSLLVIFELVQPENTIKPRFIEGEEIPDWEKGLDKDAYLQQMESQGWIVSDCQTGKTALLKRYKGQVGSQPST